MDETARRNETQPQAPVAAANWGRLTQRAEFQRAGKGRRAQVDAFTLQSNRRALDDTATGPRVGFTVTKKVGNAVVRNRIRRRLREALRRVSTLEAAPDHDYVLMARISALTAGFEALVGDVERAFRQIQRVKPRSGSPSPNRDGRS